jgi:hypothetical protein
MVIMKGLFRIEASTNLNNLGLQYYEYFLNYCLPTKIINYVHLSGNIESLKSLESFCFNTVF